MKITISELTPNYWAWTGERLKGKGSRDEGSSFPPYPFPLTLKRAKFPCYAAGIISCAIAANLSFTPLIAHAVTPVVRTLTQSQTSGSTATLQTIYVWDGHGVSISFYQVNEQIKRVWIDDPSQILIDTDGCLEGINANCQNPGAGLLHLRRIKRVNISGLPKTWATHLTIVTETQDGSRKSYHFQVAPSNGKPQYSQIEIVDQLSTPYVRPTTPTPTRTNPTTPKRTLPISNVGRPVGQRN